MTIETKKLTSIKAWETSEERRMLCTIATELGVLAECIKDEHKNFSHLESTNSECISNVTFFSMVEALTHLADIKEWEVVEEAD